MDFTNVTIEDLDNKLSHLFKSFGFKINDFKSMNDLCLGGGSVVQLYNNNLIDIDDLDIYMSDLQGFQNLKSLAFYLTYNNYEIKKHKKMDKLEQFEKIYELFKKYVVSSNINKTNKYFSLKKYIRGIIMFHNSKLNKSIDVIITKGSTKNMFLNTVDFDIVRNYITISKLKSELYMNNQNAVDNKIATMTDQHFKKRVLNNIYEFNNFITRYMKYSNKGYHIYIGNKLITRKLFNVIIFNYIKTCYGNLCISKNKEYYITSLNFTNKKTIFTSFNLSNNIKINHNIIRTYVKEYKSCKTFKKLEIKNIILNIIKMDNVFKELLSKKKVLKSLIEYQITNIKNSVNNINLEESNIILKKTNLLKTIDLLINKTTNKDIKDILYKEKNKLIDDFEII